MTFRQALIHRWRQQKPRVAVYLPKVAHPPNCPGIPSFQSYHIMRHLPPKSDRLLGYLIFNSRLWPPTGSYWIGCLGTLGLITDRFFRYLIVRFADQYGPIE